jgi:hypothetical protein
MTKQEMIDLTNKARHNKNCIEVVGILTRYIDELESRSCENCKHLEVESGVQPDGMYWQKINCNKGNVYDEWDYEIVSCLEWESKDDK